MRIFLDGYVNHLLHFQPLSGQVIVMSTNIATTTTTRPILVQTPQEQQVQMASTTQAMPRMSQPINQRLLPSSTPSQQQVKAPSLVVLQATQAQQQQQQAVVRPIQIASSSPVMVSQAAALPNGETISSSFMFGFSKRRVLKL